MGIFSNIFKRKNSEDEAKRIGGMEDFMTLIRVYYQSVMASRLGITNLAMLPDLRVFKSTLHVPTVNNKLGLGEKNKCKKMLQDVYGVKDEFFTEIDSSIKANCRNINQINNYFMLFQGFSQDLITVLSSNMQVKLRIPAFFKKTLYSVIENGVNEILTKDDFKDDAVRKGSYALRTYKQRLGYSEQWMTEYAYHIIMLAKKEPRNKNTDEKKK